ncbi:hypothetical protein C8J57DRAFT_1247576 [Mycena rebaudengoi]|nr:hypothetical protein C8J57DRAFT_1247576 [Mycena rebaudengoi]
MYSKLRKYPFTFDELTSFKAVDLSTWVPATATADGLEEHLAAQMEMGSTSMFPAESPLATAPRRIGRLLLSFLHLTATVYLRQYFWWFTGWQFLPLTGIPQEPGRKLKRLGLQVARGNHAIPRDGGSSETFPIGLANRREHLGIERTGVIEARRRSGVHGGNGGIKVIASGV